MASYGDGYIWRSTGITHDETGFPCTGDPSMIDHQIRRIHDKIYLNCDDIVMAQLVKMEDAEVAVVAMGSVARSALKAISLARAKGIKAGLCRLITIWPFPEKVIAAFAGQVRAIIVPELNLGQIQGQVRQTIEGKTQLIGVNRIDSRLITPDQILETILRGIDN